MQGLKPPPSSVCFKPSSFSLSCARTDSSDLPPSTVRSSRRPSLPQTALKPSRHAFQVHPVSITRTDSAHLQRMKTMTQLVGACQTYPVGCGDTADGLAGLVVACVLPEVCACVSVFVSPAHSLYWFLKAIESQAESCAIMNYYVESSEDYLAVKRPLC